MIARPTYIDWLNKWRDKDVIKVITGVRRCGKSTLLSLYRQQLLDNGISPKHIISINLEMLEYEHLLDYRALHQHIIEQCVDNKKHYVFIDEIQNVTNFQKTVDSLYVRPNIDLYITGSNAFLLRGTLTTLLSGRYVELNVLPLSFSEYYSARPSMSITRAYSEYVDTGSLPAIIHLNDPILVKDYLSGIVDTVLLKDVMGRLGIQGAHTLTTLTAYLFDNIANITSANKIVGALNANGTTTNTKTILAYLDALTDSYIFYSAKRFDLKGKKILKNQQKYYGVDMGMRHHYSGSTLRDEGRILENVIFLELKRRYSSVYVGQSRYGEIDFVALDGAERAYYQVSLSLHNPHTYEREISSFHNINDNYPKYIITLDDATPVSHNGIQQIYALDWLTS